MKKKVIVINSENIIPHYEDTDIIVIDTESNNILHDKETIEEIAKTIDNTVVPPVIYDFENYHRIKAPVIFPNNSKSKKQKRSKIK